MVLIGVATIRFYKRNYLGFIKDFNIMDWSSTWTPHDFEWKVNCTLTIPNFTCFIFKHVFIIRLSYGSWNYRFSTTSVRKKEKKSLRNFGNFMSIFSKNSAKENIPSKISNFYCFLVLSNSKSFVLNVEPEAVFKK